MADPGEAEWDVESHYHHPYYAVKLKLSAFLAGMARGWLILNEMVKTQRVGEQEE